MQSLLLALACTPDAPQAPPPVLGSDPAPEERVLPHPERPPLRINEVMTSNESAWQQPDGTFPDWIELYNASGGALDLSRAALVDGDARAAVGAGPLPPGGRVLLLADGSDAQGHLPFAFGSDGEELVLTWDGVAVDRIRTGALGDDLSLARFPDGGAWAPTARPTPGYANGSRGSDTLDVSESLFDLDRVHPVEVTLSSEAMARLDAEPYTDVIAGLGFEGFQRDCVGIRKKGVYGSLRSIYAKPAIKIDVTACGLGDFRGIETITLNNMVQDPSAVHEALIYAFLRGQGLPAPRTGWARLSINGEDRGFYLLLETPDENLLARWWDDPTGNLYEGAYGVDFYQGYEWSFEQDEGPADNDRSDLTAVATVLDGAPDDAGVAALERLVDLDQFLKVMAVEALALHWDGYTTSNNYRVYRDPADGRFDMIPWGMDQTFVDYWYGPYDARGRLFTFCMRNAGCVERYQGALRELADAWDAWGFEARMNAHLALVTPEVETDPRREYDLGTHAYWIDRTRETLRSSPARIRAALPAR
jgi:hypothetical protein